MILKRFYLLVSLFAKFNFYKRCLRSSFGRLSRSLSADRQVGIAKASAIFALGLSKTFVFQQPFSRLGIVNASIPSALGLSKTLMCAVFVMLVVMMTGLRAQVPQRFTYQTVVRDAQGALVAERPVGLRISIVQSNPQGEAVYVETHQPVTNSNGLFTVLLGGGQVQQGQFDAIRWGEGPYFVKSEMDLQGGTTYTIEVVQQLVSVPYALHAVSADELTHPVDYDSIVAHAISSAGFLLAEQQVLSIGHDTIYLTGGSYVKLPATVSFSGSYNDLTDLPSVWDSSYASLKGVPPTWDSSYSSLKGVPPAWDSSYTSLKGVPPAWDSSYSSLKGVPTNVSAFVNDASYLTSYTEQQVLSIGHDTIYLTGGSYVKLPATTSFSGSYNDLTDLPLVWDSSYTSLKGIPPAWDSSYTSLKGVPPAWDSNYASLKGVPPAWDSSYVSLKGVPPAWDSSYASLKGIPPAWDSSYASLKGIPPAWDSSYASLKGVPPAWDSSYASLKGVPPAWDSSYASLKGVPPAWDSSYASLKGVPPAWDSSYASLKGVPPAWDSSYASLKGVPPAWDSSYASLKGVPTNVSAFVNDASYLTSYTEQQTLAAVTALGNNAGDKQLKGLKDPTEAQDAVTYHLLQDVQQLIVSLQTTVDSMKHVLDSINNTPVVTTKLATDITATGAVSGGSIFSNGEVAVTERGVCWSTWEEPMVDYCVGRTTDGIGNGSFSSTIMGLSAGTTYYVRAYAINSVDTAYGDVVQFTTECGNITCGLTVTKGDNGALPGSFSVSATKKVYFSQGNLQYTTTGEHACVDGTTKQGTWCFAANQYDYIGCGNENIDSRYTGYIDLFGWGTSGSDDCNPYLKTSTTSDYGPSGDMAGTNSDWGVYNAISNGGNVAGKWRTLTKSEWEYLYNGRTNASSKWGYATVNGVHGVVFLPDSWTMPLGCAFTAGKGSGWTTNNYTTTQWTAMEVAGALFLPAAGYRDAAMIINVGNYGSYWSSTANGNFAYNLYFDNGSGPSTAGFSYRYCGRYVRLVCDKPVLPTLTTTVVTDISAPVAMSGGTITSDGGAEVSERGVCWGTSSTPTISNCLGKTTDGTGTGSFSSTITGLSDGTTYYVRAYATNSEGIAYGEAFSFTAIVQGAMDGLFSVSATKKVHFAAGNLQYTTTGTHACADSTTKPGTWRFADHQYDYVGDDNANISDSYAGYIDLFGWGTSGYNNCNPYLTASTSNYGLSSDIAGTNYDWGVYNAISNGGNVAGKWRTLTQSEWYYLCNNRTNASSKWGYATVNGVHGVVFLPDSWIMPSGCAFTSGSDNGWTTNNCTTTQWKSMDGAGALFLPAAGYRSGDNVNEVDTYGYYWSSTVNVGSNNNVYCLRLESSPYTSHAYASRYGSAVRLVCE